MALKKQIRLVDSILLDHYSHKGWFDDCWFYRFFFYFSGVVLDFEVLKLMN
jgi:hypothetical protein